MIFLDASDLYHVCPQRLLDKYSEKIMDEVFKGYETQPHQIPRTLSRSFYVFATQLFTIIMIETKPNAVYSISAILHFYE